MELFDESPSNAHEYSVSEISGAVKRVIEGEFSRIRVRGEVGRVFRAKSGHLYFDIKDDRSVLASVAWKGQIGALSHLPEEGMEIVATGRLTTFGSQSKYQLTVEEVQPAGMGALMAMLEKRRKALEAEGLFAEARKRPLPFLPEVIGVVTSPAGAVIRDILHRLRDRFPRKVLVWPVAVQGRDCPAQVARAIAGFNALEPGGAVPRPDLLIVARGGGSIEDLWGFNDEAVVRAAAASAIPLISAVGHETDWTLIDHAADRRAPTPTAAAELAVPVRLELAATIDGQAARLSRGLAQAIAGRRQRVADLSRALPRPETLTRPARQRLDTVERDLPRALQARVTGERSRLAEVGAVLNLRALQRRLSDAREAANGRGARLGPAMQRALGRRGERLADIAARHRPRPLLRRLETMRGELAGIDDRLGRATAARAQAAQARLDAAGRLLEGLSYTATLKRGYAVVRDGERVVTTRAAATDAAALEIEFQDGRLALSRPRKPRGKESPPEQGTLL
ncbi:exodeoxyribonuclease VII large subunit [Palleronia sediminis]|uniref:Exodeoxyribonuclease 7 large subunit n=1 Tax=Palleronia sediminis TaxID=2547833 RepID=A0A4R6AA85_9RHOB|nr:exodeoxyribonuclease VII large subunit [Palleronia sediminis]TDL79835.1 exodeoxyribonuclease VII large subunit [Palleronia sediminis]